MKQATDRRLHILFIVTKATQGGAQRYVHDLATGLPQDRFVVSILYGQEGRLSQTLKNLNFRTYAIPALGRDIALISDIQSLLQMYNLIKELRPDVVHLNSSKAAALGALGARLAGAQRVVFTVHGWPFKERRNILWRAFVYTVSWVTALLSHSVIVVSETDRRIGRNMPGIANKIVCIPLGIQSINPLPPSEGFARIFGSGKPPPVSGNTLRLITIAELTANKGIRYAIGAVSELKRRDIDSVYVIAGEGEERGSLEKDCAKLGVEDRVYLPGFVEHAPHYLSGFDVFLLPSLKEGMPYVLLEAAMAGLPMVVTSAVDKELAEKIGTVRIVPPADFLAIADALEELSRRPVASKQQNPFPLSQMIAQTVDVYRA